jgi:hypothetical protein
VAYTNRFNKIFIKYLMSGVMDEIKEILGKVALISTIKTF